MPSLHRIGKDKVINHHHEVPYRVLQKQYDFGDAKSGNMIIHGDNLEWLKSLLPQYEGKIKCIYIDPPYNTGNEWRVYNDNMNHPKIKKRLGQIVGKEWEDFNRHDKWLCMMYPRLKLLHKLLRDDGVIFVSIDDNEQANLKLMMDEIFGPKNFVGNIARESKTKSQNTKDSFSKLQPKIEHIFVYTKKDTRRFNLIQKGEKEYLLNDDKGIYREHILEVMNADGMRWRESMVFEIEWILPPAWKQWQLGLDQVSTYQSSGSLFVRNGKIVIKMRPDQERSELTEPFWGFLPKEIGTAESWKKELNQIFWNDKHWFETVKPISLVEKLIFHASNPWDIVLDSFAWSWTTAHAVLNLNKKDLWNRKFILLELMDYADTITAERAKRVINGYGEWSKAVEWTWWWFSYYTLGDQLFDSEDNLNENIDLEIIKQYIRYTETKTEYISQTKPYFLWTYKTSDYYFYYEYNKATVLDIYFLSSLPNQSEYKLIYADICHLSKVLLAKHKIIFKKIPRDITRF